MRIRKEPDRIVLYVTLAAVLAGLLTSPRYVLGAVFTFLCIAVAMVLPTVIAYVTAATGYFALSWTIIGSQRLYGFYCRNNVSAGLATVIVSFTAGVVWACL